MHIKGLKGTVMCDFTKLKKADIIDFDRLSSFYKKAINNSANTRVFARWVYREHPTDDIIKNTLR